ncbi:MAG: hypothetical protein V8T12_00520 [Parabacteroides johnsonii]
MRRAGWKAGYFFINLYGTSFWKIVIRIVLIITPYWLLRNLWMLSRDVAPQSLQIEFLNKWRNKDKYAREINSLRQLISFDYLFAETMSAGAIWPVV